MHRGYFGRSGEIVSLFGWKFEERRPGPTKPYRGPIVHNKPPAQRTACVLTIGELLKAEPHFAPLFQQKISTAALAQIYGTLLNSAIVPPSPWPQQPHVFDHIATLPAALEGTPHPTVFFVFVFYPL